MEWRMVRGGGVEWLDKRVKVVCEVAVGDCGERLKVNGYNERVFECETVKELSCQGVKRERDQRCHVGVALSSLLPPRSTFNSACICFHFTLNEVSVQIIIAAETVKSEKTPSGQRSRRVAVCVYLAANSWELLDARGRA